MCDSVPAFGISVIAESRTTKQRESGAHLRSLLVLVSLRLKQVPMKPLQPIQKFACELEVLGVLVGHWPEHPVFDVENRRARKRDQDG